jgi:glutathione S-transferase
MKLYGFPLSNNTMKPLVVARLLSLPIEFKMVDLAKGEQRKPEFLKLSPTGRTPVLVDDDFVLWESDAIMMYLASQKPNSLWPEGARERADIARWMFWEQAHWARACGTLLFERVLKKMMNLGEPDPAQIQMGNELLHREATMLNRHLEDREYLVGNDLTIADIAVGSQTVYTQMAQYPMERYPNIVEFFARIEAVIDWQRVVAPVH